MYMAQALSLDTKRSVGSHGWHCKGYEREESGISALKAEGRQIKRLERINASFRTAAARHEMMIC